MSTENTNPPAVVNEPHGNVVAMAPRKEPSAPRRAASFVKRHPLLVVAGGVAAGIAVSAFLPRRYTMPVVAGAAKAARSAGAATLLFGKQAAGAAEEAGETAMDTAASLASAAGHTGAKAAGQLSAFAIAALGAISAFGKAAAHKAEDLAEDLGETASEKAHRLHDLGEDLRKRMRA
jgi:hypothetical protein